MTGRSSEQFGPLEADQCLGHIGRRTFCGFLTLMRGHFVRDEEFVVFNCANNGRDGEPPSIPDKRHRVTPPDVVRTLWSGVPTWLQSANQAGYGNGHRPKVLLDSTFIADGDRTTSQAFVGAKQSPRDNLTGHTNKTHSPRCDLEDGHEAGIYRVRLSTRSVVTCRADPSGQTRTQGLHLYRSPCEKCRLLSAHVATRKENGRNISLHPQEPLLQQAGLYYNDEAFAGHRKIAEHHLDKLVPAGTYQARYSGRIKTQFQLLMAAMADSLTLVAGRTGIVSKTSYLAAFLFGSAFRVGHIASRDYYYGLSPIRQRVGAFDHIETLSAPAFSGFAGQVSWGEQSNLHVVWRFESSANVRE